MTFAQEMVRTFPLLVPEQERREGVQVLPPDLPLVRAGHAEPLMMDARALQGGMDALVGGIEPIAGPAADPEQPDLRVGGPGVRQRAARGVEAAHHAAERTDPAEAVEVLQPDAGCLPRAHGEPRDG